MVLVVFAEMSETGAVTRGISCFYSMIVTLKRTRLCERVFLMKIRLDQPIRRPVRALTLTNPGRHRIKREVGTDYAGGRHRLEGIPVHLAFGTHPK
jgi:hypothetical protein